MKSGCVFLGYVFFSFVGCVIGRGGDRFSSLSSLKEWVDPNPLPGCVLGNEHYRLKEKFSPPIEPYGKMNCLICQCIPLMKKGILHHYGKVRCVKLENECPLPNCPNPVLLPGKCCKSCPGETMTFEDRYSLLPVDLEAEVDAALTGDGKTIDKYKSKNYIALLVGRNVPGRIPVYTRAVAVVRLKVTSTGGIQYTLRHERLNRPKSIQVIDRNGNVLIQKRLDAPSDDNKYCGEWTSIPFYYLRYLHKKEILITITTFSYPEGEVSGRPEVDTRKNPETFGALLVSPKLDGTGGYAALTYGLKKKRISYTIIHDGLFNSKRKRQEYFITIEKRTKILHQKTRKTRRKNKMRGFWKSTNKKNRKLLVRGRLRLRLTSKGGSSIIGYIKPVFTCGTYQAVLSTGQSLHGRQGPLASAGSAVFDVHDNGDVDYKIRLFNMQNIVTSISVDTPTKSGSRNSRMRDVIRTYVRNGTSYDGMATGKLSKLKARDIALLQAGKLHINVATIANRISVLRGSIQRLDYLSHVNIFQDPPTMLMSTKSSPTGVAGHTWITVGDDCVLHYQIVLSGWRGQDEDLTALITGDYDTTVSTNAIYTIIITDFHDGKARGTVADMSEEVFLSLNRGTSFLHIEVKGQRKGEIRTNLTIPNNCWQVFNDQIPDVFVDEYGNPITTHNPRLNCRYNGVVYRDSDTWRQNITSCATCICNRGDVQCHPVVCPELTCMVKKMSEDGCCPVCADDTYQHETAELDEAPQANSSCYYPGDKRWHPAGTQWYPYVPPFGYVTCSICSCEPGSDSYKCVRKECPALECPRSQAIRLKDTDCCQTCPHAVSEPPAPKESATLPSVLPPELPQKRGCSEEARATAQWSRVPPFGLRNCYVCRCRGGSIKCRMKERCNKNNCRNCKTEGTQGERSRGRHRAVLTTTRAPRR
ncbi:chordin-like [Argopecten irradians]|uniref:chordin-like n=1 Tax=Argopecten irradians TaxID=31199 RepID=UPI0037163295